MRLPTRLLQRKPDAHKGDFGHLFIVAGSLKFSGAALLCAEAALRSGAGLVTLAVPEGIALSLIKVKAPEVMLLPLMQTKQGFFSEKAYNQARDFLKNADILVVGPGVGREKTTQVFTRKLIAGATVPTVIDADGLNALSGHLNILRKTHNARRTTLLTPHPGEMARLTGVGINLIQDNREKAAVSFAKENRVTLVLKGHNTVVADYKGNLYVNKTGNPGMATAGSGDVLSGILGAFLGQGLEAFSAAKYAVYLHGLAGDLAAKEKTQISLIASDIIAKIPEAIKHSS
ncbi:MAG: NAD(P)H-hydrate dehydratase [Candidatus Omnitrophota bacterium]